MLIWSAVCASREGYALLAHYSLWVGFVPVMLVFAPVLLFANLSTQPDVSRGSIRQDEVAVRRPADHWAWPHWMPPEYALFGGVTL